MGESGEPVSVAGDDIGHADAGLLTLLVPDGVAVVSPRSGSTDLLTRLALLGAVLISVYLRMRHTVNELPEAAAGHGWFTPAGTPITDTDWGDPSARSIALLLNGATDPDLAADGTPLVDNDHLVHVNAGWEPVTFTVPAGHWEIVCDTFAPTRAEERVHATTSSNPRSVMVLQRVPTP